MIDRNNTYSEGEFTVNVAQAATVRDIFGAFLHGSTMKPIFISLNDAGTPTARGGKWDTSTIRYILRNGAHAGLLQWNGVEHAKSETYPAIIAPSEYEAAHRRLSALKPGRVAKK